MKIRDVREGIRKFNVDWKERGLCTKKRKKVGKEREKSKIVRICE